MKRWTAISLCIVAFLGFAACTHAQESNIPPRVIGQALLNGEAVPCYALKNSVVCSKALPHEAAEGLAKYVSGSSLVRGVAGGVFGIALLIYLLSGIFIVDQWERKPLKRFGKFIGTLGPGVTWKEPFSTRAIDTISIRDHVDDLHERLYIKTPPSIQTHDNVPVTFKVLLTYRIVESRVADFLLNVEDDYESLWNRALTVVSEFVGNTELDSILHDRQKLYRSIEGALQGAVASWGVEIIAVELKDVSIADTSIQEAIAMKARAQKEAEAELVRAKMQTEIAKQLSEAGDAYDEAAWKLKSYETLLELCRSAENNTILVPSELMSGIATLVGKQLK